MAEQLDLAELSVGDAHRLLHTPFHIARDATPVVNGAPASSDQVLRAGDVLEFTRPAGEKGAAPALGGAPPPREVEG